MLDVAFWLEFRRRADALIWLALVNPPLLGLYALTADLGRPAIEVWLIGLGATFLICLAAALITYAATVLAIRHGVAFVIREKMWNELARRGPRMRIIPEKTEAG